ncbi:MAG: hypothetical protein ABI644_07705 [Arenimonas sp.]
MFNDSFIISFLGNMLRIVPTLLVCIAGIVIMQKHALSKKTKMYGTAGLVLMMLDAMSGVAFSTYVSSGGIDYASSNFQVLQLGFSAIVQVMYALALVLLVMAICNKEQTAVLKSEVENPYA